MAFDSLRGVCDLHPRMRVLDFGCGTGLQTELVALNVRTVTATDTSPAMVAVLEDKQISNVTAVCADILATSDDAVRQTQFDLITAASVCSFLPDYEGAVADLRALLLPGGRFVHWDWASDDGLTMPRVQTALSDAGLQNVTAQKAFDMGGMPVLIGTGCLAL